MKVLVTGGRDYADIDRVFSTLDHIHADTPITYLINGGASGADSIGKHWAMKRGIQPVTCDALWDFWGSINQKRRAGPERNKAMLGLKPDQVVAFPGGSGTAGMVALAKAAGIPVFKCLENQCNCDPNRWADHAPGCKSEMNE